MVAIAGGDSHSLALKSDGTVWAWGYNGCGQLGDGSTTNRLTPVQVSGLTGVVAIAGGGSHSLALKSDGTVWAWGCNDYGQLGDGTTTNRLTPVQVSGLTGVVAIAGGGAHSLALKSDGTVWAWGATARPTRRRDHDESPDAGSGQRAHGGGGDCRRQSATAWP